MKHERNAVKELNEWGQVPRTDIIINLTWDIYGETGRKSVGGLAGAWDKWETDSVSGVGTENLRLGNKKGY